MDGSLGVGKGWSVFSDYISDNDAYMVIEMRKPSNVLGFWIGGRWNPNDISLHEFPYKVKYQAFLNGVLQTSTEKIEVDVYPRNFTLFYAKADHNKELNVTLQTALFCDEVRFFPVENEYKIATFSPQKFFFAMTAGLILRGGHPDDKLDAWPDEPEAGGGLPAKRPEPEFSSQNPASTTQKHCEPCSSVDFKEWGQCGTGLKCLKPLFYRNRCIKNSNARGGEQCERSSDCLSNDCHNLKGDDGLKYCKPGIGERCAYWPRSTDTWDDVNNLLATDGYHPCHCTAGTDAVVREDSRVEKYLYPSECSQVATLGGVDERKKIEIRTCADDLSCINGYCVRQ